jgi:hypothetical protein
MITDADVKKLKRTFVTKTDFNRFSDYYVKTFATKAELQEVKEDVAGVKEDTNKILYTVDRISKTLEEWEYPAFKADVNRHDREIKKLAAKTGTAL